MDYAGFDSRQCLHTGFHGIVFLSTAFPPVVYDGYLPDCVSYPTIRGGRSHLPSGTSVPTLRKRLGNAEPVETESATKKAVRRAETDTLASLVEYAESQGSRNMQKNVYKIYTKLVNELVGIESGQRDSVPFKTISVIGFLEDMILHTVAEEMQKGTHYKEIYRICKANGEQIMRFAYLPATNGIAS